MPRAKKVDPEEAHIQAILAEDSDADSSQSHSGGSDAQDPGKDGFTTPPRRENGSDAETHAMPGSSRRPTPASRRSAGKGGRCAADKSSERASQMMIHKKTRRSAPDAAASAETEADKGKVKNKCMHCLGMFAADDMHKRGRAWACRPCNGARMALQAHYKAQNKLHQWSKMTKRDRNSLIASHRGKTKGKGRRFPIEITEEAV